MSIFHTETFPCPKCDEPVTFDVSASVNADRRPDLRDAILDGSFQRGTCSKCGNTFRIEPQLTYFDAGRKQWILVKPAEDLKDWISLEREAQETFDIAYGAEAGPAAREIGRGIQVRVTFGWPALQEKLLCAGADLDDVALELLKISLIRSLDHSPLSDETELRLKEVRDDELELVWLRSREETPVESVTVPRDVYDEVVKDEEGYRELREEISAGPFVDIHRLLVPTE